MIHMSLLPVFLALVTALQEPVEVRPAARYRLWVSGYTSQTVHRYEADTGEGVGTLGEIPGAQSIQQGPDGLLYVVAEEIHEVHRYRPDGTFVDRFVKEDPDTEVKEAGGLKNPTAAVFGRDGNLYVCSFSKNNVLRFDGRTGLFLDVFVPSGEGEIDGPDAGMQFGPDGDLWVPCFNANKIVRYDGKTGEPLGPWASEGLANPRDMVFQGKSVFVTSWGNDRIVRFDEHGNFKSVFATTVRPSGIAIAPFDKNFYVTTDDKNNVKVIDSRTGESLGKVVQNNAEGLSGGTYVAFVREGAAKD